MWNPADYGHVARLIVDGTNLWRPEITLANSVDEVSDLSITDKSRCCNLCYALMTFLHPGFEILSFNDIFVSSRVQIFSNGKVSRGPIYKWKTACVVDLSYFPFDEQTCNITFSSWAYDGTQLNDTLPAAASEYTEHLKNGEWNILSKTISRKEVLYSGDGWIFIVPSEEITLNLKRKPTYSSEEEVVRGYGDEELEQG